LLRIEPSTKELYNNIHPADEKHDFEVRIKVLETPKRIGYQFWTCVMVELPFQTIEHLVDDLLYLKIFDMNMWSESL